MRLIDGDELHDCIMDNDIHNGIMSVKNVYEFIEEAPTVDAVPVVHGKWLLRHEGHGHYWECSVCHTNPCIYVTNNTNYCPNCGARMDKGEMKK